MGMDESFLVQFVLNSLPSQFAPFKIHYNTNRDQWNLNELTSKSIQKVAKLKALGMGMDESFLVQFVLNSLPSQFAPFKIHYNTNRDQWNLNELTSKSIQEEVRLRQEGHNIALAVAHGVTKKKGKFKKRKELST